MKYIRLLALIMAVTFVGFSQNALAQFEGVIKFDKIKSETTKYTYYVKGDHVRVEETGSDGKIKGIMIVDISKGSVTALSPERKLYMDATNKRKAPVISPKITKTKNTKKVLDYDCTEWTVKNDADETEIHYWVADGKFEFFVPLLTTLNRKDKLSRYFLTIENNTGVFPFVGVETGYDGTAKSELKVTSISEESVADGQFEVPSNYQKFEK